MQIPFSPHALAASQFEWQVCKSGWWPTDTVDTSCSLTLMDAESTMQTITLTKRAAHVVNRQVMLFPNQRFLTTCINSVRERHKLRSNLGDHARYSTRQAGARAVGEVAAAWRTVHVIRGNHKTHTVIYDASLPPPPPLWWCQKENKHPRFYYGMNSMVTVYHAMILCQRTNN